MSVRTKTSLCAVFFLIGFGLFVVDVLNPTTPTPLVTYRPVILAAQLFFVLEASSEGDSPGSLKKFHSLTRNLRSPVFDIELTVADHRALFCSRLI